LFLKHRKSNFATKKTMTIDELKRDAVSLRDEQREAWITPDRVGSLFLEIINKIADGGSGIKEAPDDGKLYGRQNKEWVEIGIDTFP
jgi:hypothetical protein